MHDSTQYDGWLLLTGICVPHLLTVHEQEPCDHSMHYGEAMHVKHTAPVET